MRSILVLCLFVSSAFAANLKQTLEHSGEFKTFLTLIERAGLSQVLENHRRLTVFAPTDEAFSRLATDEISVILNSEELLLSTLKLHIARPVLTKKILKVLNGVETISGKYLTKFASENTYTLENALIEEYDIHASNGVAHKIDSVFSYRSIAATNDIRPVDYVDLERYQGRWFEIYRFPNKFEKGCGNVTADYKIKSNGSVNVLNTCVLSSGKVKKSKGTAFVVNRETNATLKVSFVPFLQRWGLFAGDYNILYLEKDYEFVMVGSKDRNYLWFLSRSPELTQDQYELLRSQAISQGYDPDKLIKTPKF